MSPNFDHHHRRSLRLKGYDYTQAGAYFVTICTERRQLFFDEEPLRKIAEDCWLAIPTYNEGVSLDEWVVMPNHLHGIIVLEGNPPKDILANPPKRDASNPFSMMSPKRGSLGVIIRKYKGAVTTLCRSANRFDFGWQRNYYEHIIRNERALDAIRAYIANNPANWQSDRDNLINLKMNDVPTTIDDYVRDAGIARGGV